MTNTPLPARPQQTPATASVAPLDARVGHAVQLAIPELSPPERALIADYLHSAAHLAFQGRTSSVGRVFRTALTALVDSCPDQTVRAATHRTLKHARPHRLRSKTDCARAQSQLLKLATAIARNERGPAATAASITSFVIFG